ASFACEAVGFGGFGGLGFGADGGALSGAGGVAGGGFGLNLAVTEEKTPDFHFSPFAPTVAACALKNSASIRRTSSLMGAPVFSFSARSVFIWSTSIKSRRAWRRLRFTSFRFRFCAGSGAVWGLQQGRLHLRQWQRRRLRRGRLRRYGEPVVKLLTGLFGGVAGALLFHLSPDTPRVRAPASPTNAALLLPDSLRYFVSCIKQRTPNVLSDC